MTAVGVLTSDFVFDRPFEIGFFVSLDRGVNWSHVSFFVTAVIITAVVVIATNANHPIC